MDVQPKEGRCGSTDDHILRTSSDGEGDTIESLTECLSHVSLSSSPRSEIAITGIDLMKQDLLDREEQFLKNQADKLKNLLVSYRLLQPSTHVSLGSARKSKEGYQRLLEAYENEFSQSTPVQFLLSNAPQDAELVQEYKYAFISGLCSYLERNQGEFIFSEAKAKGDVRRYITPSIDLSKTAVILSGLREWGGSVSLTLLDLRWKPKSLSLLLKGLTDLPLKTLKLAGTGLDFTENDKVNLGTILNKSEFSELWLPRDLVNIISHPKTNSL